MSLVQNKVAIITGAASGQGAAEARLFAAQGAKVVVADIDEAGRSVAAACGANAHYIRLDVSKRADWATVMKQTLDRYGRLDVLVNNAAVFKPVGFLETSDANWEIHYRVNQLGVFLGMRAAVEAMRKTQGGSIVNISSISGLSSHPGAFAYATSKWAVRGMSKVAATELAPLGIRVNAVYPGMIDTPMLAENGPEQLKQFAMMIPMKRLGTPEEVAQLVLFLASDAASYVTGAEITVGGGMS